ncbi:MAG: helix-turn-helix domain-containing protein [Alphaproteobacteria bacterium]|nr:helix-turn-helix domain-containing protein [Alphaproteobacteria bacterium]
MHNTTRHPASQQPVHRPADARVAPLPKPGPVVIVVTEQEAAKMLSVSMRHLQRLRGEGDGPPCIQLGPRRIGYRVADLDAWLSGRLIETRQQPIATQRGAK